MKRILLASACVVACAHSPFAYAADNHSTLVAVASQKDPEAINALTAMGTALRSKSEFAVQALVTSEDVLDDGQKLQRSAIVDMSVRRPNGFKVSIRDGRKDRDLFYDGKSFVVYAPRLGHYASFEAPSTIMETLHRARHQFGIELPLVDLFLWGTDASPLSQIQSARWVGSDIIGGRDCEHYAMRQETVDWQVWINEADDSLPCKLVITSRTDEAMPQFTATYSWRETIDRTAAFAFIPPPGANLIAFKPAANPEDK